MQFTLAISPKIIAQRLLWGVLLLTLLSIPVQIGKYIYGYRADWTRMINLDREMNLPTWYTALMLAFCAVLLGAIASGKKRQDDRYSRYWRILAIIFWGLAIDEVFSLHEILIIPDLAKTLNLPGIWRSTWVIPGTIVVIVFVQKYWKFVKHLPPSSRRHFLWAALFYIGGALGMEMVGSQYASWEGQQNLIYALLATLEEVMEMIGVIIFIYGLLHYLGQWAKDLQVQIQISDGLSKAKSTNPTNLNKI